ncbi:large ribosomal subunit protein bL35m-like [Asterias amurensis]|uniref:large ribosomal subunit protein bL35m-like n=1 Tax=Asterias amurensis TaxID=7602 RepID=UPI003AB46791
MAAPIRSVLVQAQKIGARICCSRSYLQTRPSSLYFQSFQTTTTPKLLVKPELKAQRYNLSNQAIATAVSLQIRSYSLLAGSCNVGTHNTGLLQRLAAGTTLAPQRQPTRTVIRYSRNKGKKKSVRAVLDRFYRFDNGLWLRTIAGRNKKRWKKTPSRKIRNKWHVFCSKTQSKKLDLMVSGYWKRRRYFPDDPMEPFKERNFKGLSFYPGQKTLERMDDP